MGFVQRVQSRRFSPKSRPCAGCWEGWAARAAGVPARCSSELQGLFITPEETFELKSGLEGRAGSAVAGGSVAFAQRCPTKVAVPMSVLTASAPAFCSRVCFLGAVQLGWGLLCSSSRPLSCLNPLGRVAAHVPKSLLFLSTSWFPCAVGCQGASLWGDDVCFVKTGWLQRGPS